MKGRNGFGFLLAGLVLLVPLTAEGATRYVALSSEFGTVAIPPYTSLLTPAERIQDALSLAQSGDTVLVAGVPVADFLEFGWSYQERIRVPRGVVLLGGWDYNAALAGYPGANQRLFAIDSLWTVLSPLESGVAVSFLVDSVKVYDTTDVGGVPVIDSSYAYTGPDTNTVLDGFVVRGSNNSVGDGSAVLIRFGSPTVRSNVLVDSRSTGRGAGIFIGYGSPRILHNTVSLSLSVPGGGAVHVAGGSPVIRDNIVFSTAEGFGIACSDSAEGAIVSYNFFFDNQGSDIDGCAADTTNRPNVNPVFCDILNWDYRVFEESPLPGLASDGTIPGAWGIGCKAGTKYVSSGGSDIFPYNTPAHAAQRLADALAIASPGDTIRMAAGDYRENVDMVPGIVLEGGWDNVFGLSPWGKTAQVSVGTVLSPDDPDLPAMRFISGASETTQVSFLVLTGGVRGDGALVRVDSGRVELAHISVLATETPEVFGSLIYVGNAGDVEFRFSMFAMNKGLPVFDCGGSASLAIDSSNFYENDLDFAAGCGAALTDTTHKFPYFCNPEAGDYQMYQEGGLGEAAPGLLPIGALSVGCYFPAHYVHPDSGAGVFPYETPAHATADLDAMLDLAQRGDSIRFAAGTYRTNLDLGGGEYLEGGWDATFTVRDPFRTPSVLSGIAPGQPTVSFTGRFPRFSTSGGINGFVVTHEPGVTGPGVLARQGSRPTIHDCVIKDNRVDFAAYPQHPAAGLIVKGANADTQAVANVFNNTIVNNTIIGATAASIAGSGVFLQDAGISGDDLTRIQRNLVAFNRGARGGLVLNEESRQVTDNFFFANKSVDSVTSDVVVLQGAALRPQDNNRFTDPIFCDPGTGDWALSTCTPAINSVSGDTVFGALPISEDCVCPNEVFLVNPLASDPGFPFRSRRNAARKISTLTPYLSAGDTVKVALGAFGDEIELVGGVVYKGGYNVSTYGEADRGLGVSRVSGNSARRVFVGGNGVDSTTLVDGFTIAAGRADSGAAVFLKGDAAPVFTNNVFQEHRANRVGGVLLATENARPTFNYNLMFGNSVDDEGGIIHLAGAGGLLANNTITDNTGGGWALLVDDCSPVVHDNAITYNDNGVRAFGSVSSMVFDHNNVFRHDVDYDPGFLSLVDTTGQGNISVNPLYCQRGRRIYTLFDHSPMIAAGRDGGIIGARKVGCSTPVHFVNPEGSNTYPYATRETAAHRIQDALDVAKLAGFSNPADSTDEVRVTEGTYEGTIRLPSNVELLAGYSGDFNTRDVDRFKTVIDGGETGTTVVIDSGAAGTTRVRTLLDGFTITAGNGTRGGGIRIERDGRPIVRGNTIRDCRAELGGGILVEERALPTIERNVVLRDTADAGAGLYMKGPADASSSATLITNNTFVYNHATVNDAGVIQLEDANPTFSSNIVAYSTGGKGLVHTGTRNPNVRDNLFFGNAGGDSLAVPLPPGGVHLIAEPDFCDPSAENFGVLYDRTKIAAGQSAIRDLCAVTVWGSEGVGCTRPGHRFLVYADPPPRQRTPVFPYVCPANSARSLADVLDRVSEGDTVDVAGGALPTGAVYEGNYVLAKPVILRGGFDPGFLLEVPRPDSANLLAIFVPSEDGPILTVSQDAAAASNPDLVIDSTALISGITFRDGRSELENGAAIRCMNGASPKIQGNVFEENRTKNWGGAVSMEGSKSPRILDNYFHRNSAGIGGGVYLYGTSDPLVRRNIFSGNGGGLYGGIRLDGTTGGGSIDNNVFFQNAAGGISLSEAEGDLVIRNNAVVSNGGYGISLFPAFEGVRKPSLSHNDVWANSSGDYLNVDEGTGDIHAGPGFCNTEVRIDLTRLSVKDDFFRYQQCSPLLFAGSDPASAENAHIGVASLYDPTCADTVPPVLGIGFLMHSTIPNVANLFLVPSETIARDSVLIRLMYANAELETIIVGQDSIEVTVYHFDSTEVDLGASDPALSVYRTGNLELRTADTLIVEARAVDLCGQVGIARRYFSSRQFVRDQAGKMRSMDRRLELDVPAGSFAESGTVLIETLDPARFARQDRPLAGPYNLQLSQIRPTGPLSVAVSLQELGLSEESRSGVALYQWKGGRWSHIESWIDPELNAVVAPVLEGGVYAVLYADGVKSEIVPPRLFALHANQPNPFNPSTRIAFDLPTREEVSLRVFDVRGREVRTLEAKTLAPGRYDYVWDGADNGGRPVGSGVYFSRLVAGESSATRKMVLVR